MRTILLVLFSIVLIQLCVASVRLNDVLCTTRKGAEILVYEACKQDALCLKLFPDIAVVEGILGLHTDTWEVDSEMFVAPTDSLLTIAYRLDLIIMLEANGETSLFPDYPAKLGVLHPDVYSVIWNNFAPFLPRILVVDSNYPNQTRVLDCEAVGLTIPVGSHEEIIQPMVTLTTGITRYITMIHHPDICNDVNKKLIYLGAGKGMKCECIEGRACSNRTFVLTWSTGMLAGMCLITVAMTVMVSIATHQLSTMQFANE